MTMDYETLWIGFALGLGVATFAFHFALSKYRTLLKDFQAICERWGKINMRWENMYTEEEARAQKWRRLAEEYRSLLLEHAPHLKNMVH